jgi:hypothetical protein
MRFGWIVIGLGATLAVAQGCGDAASPELDQAYSAPGAKKATSGTGGSGTGAGGSSVAASGLPCDLANLLQTRCASCHGANPTAGAPMPLVTYDDLKAPSPSDPKKTNAEAALARMQDQGSPMPPLFDVNGNPEAGPSAAEVAILSAWIQGGEMHGTCGGGTGGTSGTGGSGTAGSGTAGSGTAGSGTGGTDPGTGGSGTAGSGTAGSGTAGSGTAGSGTGGAPPCTTDTWGNFAQAFFKNDCTLSCHTHFTLGGTSPNYNSVKSSAADITSRIKSGNMPQGTKLSASDKSRILLWMSCGEPM